jgi:hypothetical protein
MVEVGNLAVPVGKAGLSCSANKEFLQIFFYLLCFAY